MGRVSIPDNSERIEIVDTQEIADAVNSERKLSFEQGVKAYKDSEEKNFAQFKSDALEFVGLSDDPRGEMAWDIAINERQGQGQGLDEIVLFLMRLSKLSMIKNK